MFPPSPTLDIFFGRVAIVQGTEFALFTLVMKSHSYLFKPGARERIMSLLDLKWITLCAIGMTTVACGADPTDIPPDNATGANPNATSGPYGGQFGTWNQLPWYANPGMQNDMGLNDAQLYQLNAAYQRSYMQYQLGLNGIGANLPSDQLVSRQQQIYHGFQQDFNDYANNVLTDAAARRRYHELSLQYQGYRAFSNPRVRHDLKLSPEQIKTLNKQNAEFNKNWNRWNAQYRSNPESVSEQFTEAVAERQKNLNEVLTPEQREKWRQMTGRAYEFKPADYFADPSKSPQP